ncbi:uncharacterized protein LOC134788435 [Penaeus indicus]|uniref:uncharacterized protein LOC134788435 n=1 Tax=Penaeus indicus TaxID=29960 RepID=UPI00300C48C4
MATFNYIARFIFRWTCGSCQISQKMLENDFRSPSCGIRKRGNKESSSSTGWLRLAVYLQHHDISVFTEPDDLFVRPQQRNVSANHGHGSVLKNQQKSNEKPATKEAVVNLKLSERPPRTKFTGSQVQPSEKQETWASVASRNSPRTANSKAQLLDCHEEDGQVGRRWFRCPLDEGGVTWDIKSVSNEISRAQKKRVEPSGSTPEGKEKPVGRFIEAGATRVWYTNTSSIKDWDLGTMIDGSKGSEIVEWISENAFTQHITSPTRFREGNRPSLLDLVITRYRTDIDCSELSVPLGKSDHVVIQVDIVSKKLKPEEKWSRAYDKINAEELRDAASQITWIPDSPDADVERDGLLKGSYKSWCVYKLLRNEAQTIQRQAKYTYEKRIANVAKTNPKRYFAYVQANKKVRETVGTLEDDQGNIVANDSDKAQLLKTFFQSVYQAPSQLPGVVAGLDHSSKPMLNDFIIDRTQVEDELLKLKVNKSAGPDGIHPAILKPLASVLADPLSQLFKESIRTSTLPKDWLRATVVALHKGGSKKQTNNYRPCTTWFRKREVMSHYLLSFLDEVTLRIDEGRPVEVCYVDFRKAFDSVDHGFLIHKLVSFGIGGRAIEWLTAFLHDRSFRVKVGNFVSSEGQVLSGVPQGSVLGPMLFLMFINDLAERLNNPCFMFADDIKVAGWDLERDLEVLVILLEGVNEVRDLGVMVTKDFKPSRQCQNSAKKARGELFRLHSTMSCKEPEVFLPLYKAIVRPHLEYCIQAWSPYLKKDIILLEKVQRLATRMITGYKHLAYEDRLKKLNLFSLARRRCRGDLIEVFKMAKGISGLKFEDFFEPLTGLSTRGHCLKLRRQFSRLNIRKEFFSNRVVPLWNKLPEELVTCGTVESFKRSLDARWNSIFPELL